MISRENKTSVFDEDEVTDRIICASLVELGDEITETAGFGNFYVSNLLEDRDALAGLADGSERVSLYPRPRTKRNVGEDMGASVKTSASREEECEVETGAQKKSPTSARDSSEVSENCPIIGTCVSATVLANNLPSCERDSDPISVQSENEEAEITETTKETVICDQQDCEVPANVPVESPENGQAGNGLQTDSSTASDKLSPVAMVQIKNDEGENTKITKEDCKVEIAPNCQDVKQETGNGSPIDSTTTLEKPPTEVATQPKHDSEEKTKTVKEEREASVPYALTEIATNYQHVKRSIDNIGGSICGSDVKTLIIENTSKSTGTEEWMEIDHLYNLSTLDGDFEKAKNEFMAYLGAGGRTVVKNHQAVEIVNEKSILQQGSASSKGPGPATDPNILFQFSNPDVSKPVEGWSDGIEEKKSQSNFSTSSAEMVSDLVKNSNTNFLLQVDEKNTQLHQACLLHQTETIMDILQQNEQFAFVQNSNGEVPLHYACMDPKGVEDEAFSMLIRKNPHAIRCYDDDRNLPLHFCCMVGAPSAYVVSELLKQYPDGALIQSELKVVYDVGESVPKCAIDIASQIDHYACGGLMSLANLWDGFPNNEELASDKPLFESGWSPLHLAVANEASLEVIRAIVKAAPSCIWLKTSRGRTAYECAVAMKEKCIQSDLEPHRRGQMLEKITKVVHFLKKASSNVVPMMK